MALPTTLQRARSANVFLVAETTAGTIAAHPASSDAFALTTVPTLAQAANYTDTSEIGSELITTGRVLNYMEYATFDFEYYAKPSGRTTGTALSISNATVAGSGPYDVTAEMIDTGTIAAGDTVVIAGLSGSTTINGSRKVTSVLSNTSITFQLAANPSTITATTATATPVNLNIAPEDKILARCFGGTKYNSVDNYTLGDSSDTNVTANNATVVSYFLKNTVQTLTVTSHQETDQTVQQYTGIGSLPTSWGVSLAKDGPVTFTTGFQASKVLYAGTADVGSSGAVTAASPATITIDTPKRYASGTAVASDVLWYDSTSSLGAKFDTVNPDGTLVEEASQVASVSTNGATFTANIDNNISNNDLLIPYAPAPGCDTTTTIDQRSVQVYLADQNASLTWAPSANTDLFHADNALDVTAVSFDFDRSITTPGLTEMTGEAFPPASYTINEPTITGSVTMLLRPKDFQYMNSLREEPTRAIGVRIGTTDGKYIEMAAAAAHFEVPSASETDGTTQLEMSFTVIKPEGECDDADKFVLRYR